MNDEIDLSRFDSMSEQPRFSRAYRQMTAFERSRLDKIEATRAAKLAADQAKRSHYLDASIF